MDENEIREAQELGELYRKIKSDGLVHVYTGEGKGKTTAALGLAMRAIGHGLNACMIQFMKGGKYTGEFILARNLLPQLQIVQFGKECPKAEKIKEGARCNNCRECFKASEFDKENTKRALAAAEHATKSGKYDLVILDEINVAMNKELIEIKDVLNMMLRKYPTTELVLTGRNAPSEIIMAADLVTEMGAIKHPMDRGMPARRGIEY